jgi:hypothetical protein
MTMDTNQKTVAEIRAAKAQLMTDLNHMVKQFAKENRVAVAEIIVTRYSNDGGDTFGLITSVELEKLKVRFLSESATVVSSCRAVVEKQTSYENLHCRKNHRIGFRRSRVDL